MSVPSGYNEDDFVAALLSATLGTTVLPSEQGPTNALTGAAVSPLMGVHDPLNTTKSYLGGVPPAMVPEGQGTIAGTGNYAGGDVGTGAATLPFPLAGNGAGMNMGLSGSDQLLQDLMLASQLGGGDPNTPLFGIPFDRQVNPFGSSGLPINETLLAQMIYDNPQFAIGMGGVAEYGTPGYWNLAGMDFDPYSIYAASGGNLLSGPVDYLQFAANMYNTMGTIGSQGGGTVDAGTLLVNMVTAPADSQLGKMFSENPESFYTMALDVASAAGMSPLGQQALKLQLAGLYQEYMEVALTSNAGDVPAFHTWIGMSHPEILEAWRS